MQTARVASHIARYASRSTVSKVVRPSSLTVSSPSSFALQQRLFTDGRPPRTFNNKNRPSRPPRSFNNNDGASRTPSWFGTARLELLSEESKDLSYSDKLAYLRSKAPSADPSAILLIRNLANGTTFASIKENIPSVQFLRSTIHEHMIFAKFNSSEEAESARDTINNATSYPFGPNENASVPTYAEFAHGKDIFEKAKGSTKLYLPTYFGPDEVLKGLVEPFVPSGHVLALVRRGPSVTIDLGTPEAAEAALIGIHGQTFTVARTQSIKALLSDKGDEAYQVDEAAWRV